MKQTIFAVVLMSMLATPAFATGGRDHDDDKPKVNQDHTCQGGHNCNTYPGGNGGNGGTGVGVGIGVGVGGNATGGSVNHSGNSAVVGSGNSFVNTKGTVGDVTASGGQGGAGGSVGNIKNDNSNKNVAGNLNGNNNGNFTIEEGAIQVGPKEIPTETTQNINYSGEYKVKNVPNVSGPALTSSNDTCMGSTSGGVAVAGFGFSLGSTWSDKNCLMLKNSREMWNMGFKAAAMARMCMDDLNKEALELTGFVCPTKKEDK